MDCSTFSFDLHVLGTPPALILSQDQTLVCNLKSADGWLADCHRRARKPAMDLSCEITRTCARVLHLTTGTFNLIVKDRIALRLSGAYSVQNEFVRVVRTFLSAAFLEQIRLSSKTF
jgi:hypothetical protein